MTLVSQAGMLEDARRGGYAVGSFNVVNTDSLLGALDAAEALSSPVIIAVTHGHAEFVDLEALAPSIVACAERSSVPVALHYDHATSIGEITRALRCGLNSVMYDGYGAPWETRLEETRTVVEMAHALGAVVEAALSAQSREETGNPTGVWELPTRAMVEEFVDSTGVDTIAIGEGSSDFDQQRLEEVGAYQGAFASLHGGSQLPDATVAEMIAAGLAKCSVYSKLASGAMSAVGEYATNGGQDLLQVVHATRTGYAATVRREIERFGSANRV